MLRKRSIGPREARDIADTLERLNNVLGTEFDGVLTRYDDKGNFSGLYWQDTESEEWLYDPQGSEWDKP